ncbi:MAG: Imm15 family immunity protein [Candidatus Thiodiazotropha sp.]|jgi:hypothetical protein
MDIPSNLLSEKYVCRDCLSSECVLAETDTFEEFPLFSRDSQFDAWVKIFHTDTVFEVQLGIAFFLLRFHNSVKNRSPNEFSRSFLCITIQWEENERYGLVPIPCIFSSTSVTEDFMVERLTKREKETSSESQFVADKFRTAGLEGRFHFYESRFFDDASKSEIVRTYCILSNNRQC